MARKNHPRKTKSFEAATQPRGRGFVGEMRRALRQAPGLWIGVGILLVLAAAALVVWRPVQSLPSEVTATQAYEEYQTGAFFLDVRSQSEWDQGHIQGSVLIPLDELSNRLEELPRDQDIVVICRSGVRSKEGAAILRQAGFGRVTCLTGGLNAWTAAGYPLEQ